MPKSTAVTIRKAADPTLRFTKLDLNGKSYSLVYDFEAIAQAEEMTGMELLIGVDWKKINARRIRAMLFASMLKAHPDITLEEVGSLITVANLQLIEAALVQTWFQSTQTAEDQENPQKPERERQTATG